ncbi:restriction endonuclease subunit S [Cronobacter sakazakii]|uniref:restriction endonuclease subunit S n=1 Tax=Cronobacter sakazakii TaxID=28141 RepID=UPI001C13091F|nr:restriction endonuclease subunit S [Cronobacter sakazakii]ELY2678325.1 restriction endonuclease subunit S [Cronobacter sakazakii]
MRGNHKQKLLPRMRFPEFHNDGEWKKEKLAKFLVESRIEGSTGDTAKKITVKLWGKGVFAKEEPIKGSENTKYYKRRAGQFIYSKLDFLNQAFGIVPKELDGFESTVDLPCFDINDELNAIFLLEYVKRNDFYKKNGEIADGGRKAKRIQTDVFLSFPIILPAHNAEQQKIADCLSSLDDLLTAEVQKLDALKKYKKGLMQQLFPREEETEPRLRFPEFREAEEWETKTLLELAENLNYLRVPVTEKDRTKGNIPYYGASGIVDYINDFIFDEDLLCISEDGANLVARTTPIAFSISGKTWVNNHAHVLRFGHWRIQKIVEDYLNSISLEDYLTGMAQPKLNRAMLDTVPVPIPQDEDEQQAIADCLSSLDDLIIAQAKKIEALKNHKRGLVQQLFPVLDEVSA